MHPCALFPIPAGSYPDIFLIFYKTLKTRTSKPSPLTLAVWPSIFVFVKRVSQFLRRRAKSRVNRESGQNNHEGGDANAKNCCAFHNCDKLLILFLYNITEHYKIAQIPSALAVGMICSCFLRSVVKHTLVFRLFLGDLWHNALGWVMSSNP